VSAIGLRGLEGGGGAGPYTRRSRGRGGAVAQRGQAAPPARRVGERRLRGAAPRPGSWVPPALGVGRAGTERRGGEGEGEGGGGCRCCLARAVSAACVSLGSRRYKPHF